MDVYMKSLENIFTQEQGIRKERAKELLRDYREGNDRKVSKKWDKTRKLRKDMLDDIGSKLLRVGKYELRPYVIGIQTYMTEVRVYLIEKREVYFLHHLKSFNIPLTFSTYHYLKVALRVAWNIRGLVNSLIRELDNDANDDGFKTPPYVMLDNMKTKETPPNRPKRKKTKNLEN